MQIAQFAPGIWKLTFGTPETVVPSRQNYVKKPRVEALRQLPLTTEIPFSKDKIEFTLMSRGCRLILPLSAGEDIYGLGLQLKRLRHTGKKRTLRVNSDPSTDTGDSHAPAPVYFSTSGYGVMIDTARYAAFYCGGNRRLRRENSSIATEKKNIALTEAELYAGSTEADAPMVVDIPAAKGIEVYVFSGPSMLHAVRRFVLFSGGGCLPPEWGLGVWYRLCGTADQNRAEAMAEELRRDHIPCDVLGLEPGWQSQSYSCSLSWSKERFPQPERLIRKLQASGYHVNLWQHIFLHPSSPLYQPMLSHAGDFEVWKGLIPDLTVPEATESFVEYHCDQFTRNGISSFKLDECDNSDFIAFPWSFPECSTFPSGADGEQMHSMLGPAYQHAVELACRRADVRTYGSVRSSHLFSSPLPFAIYSDLYKHEDFIRGVSSCGFAGMLWTPELRDATSEEDYILRLQSLLLSPQMLLNIWAMPHPPWCQLDREENCAGNLLPESSRQRLMEITRQLLRLRMRFIPYLYSAFADYYFSGIPPFRALTMDYPDETSLRDVDYAWMAGPDLLVIPFTAGMAERRMPLPPGIWFDFYDGRQYTGDVHLHPSMSGPPILVRENATIPLTEPTNHFTPEVKHRLTLQTYGRQPRPACLFVDDGVSFAYENGGGVWTELGIDGSTPSEAASRYQVIAVIDMLTV